MTDFHTHVLPGIDDGANSPNLSHAMLKRLKEDGVDKVLLTPHFYWGESTVEKFLEQRKEAFEKMSVPEGMTAYLGAEVEFGSLKIDYSSLSKLHVANTRYILLELPFNSHWDKSLFDNIRALSQETRCVPVVAHVNRYTAVKKNPAHVSELLSLGCLLQVNADSVIEAKPHSLIDVLMRYGQIQTLGTDAHNMGERRPRYGEAISVIRQKYGDGCVDLLQECMKRMLNDERIQVPYIHNVKRFFRYYR